MTEPELIRFISARLKEKELLANKISPKKYPNQEIPDLQVNYDKGSLFFAEIKQPGLVPFEDTQFFLHDTTMNKLSYQLHKAAKQFRSVNSLHLAPNVLIWVSEDMQLHVQKFIDLMSGLINVGNNTYRDYTNADFFKRNKQDWTTIDLHLWLDMRNGKLLQRFSFVNVDLKLINNVLLERIESSLEPDIISGS